MILLILSVIGITLTVLTIRGVWKDSRFVNRMPCGKAILYGIATIATLLIFFQAGFNKFLFFVPSGWGTHDKLGDWSSMRDQISTLLSIVLLGVCYVRVVRRRKLLSGKEDKRSLNGWIGKHVDWYIEQAGPPTQTYKPQTGMTLYIWDWQGPTAVLPSSDYSVFGVVTETYKTTLWVTNEGLIKSFKAEGYGGRST